MPDRDAAILDGLARIDARLDDGFARIEETQRVHGERLVRLEEWRATSQTGVHETRLVALEQDRARVAGAQWAVRVALVIGGGLLGAAASVAALAAWWAPRVAP